MTEIKLAIEDLIRTEWAFETEISLTRPDNSFGDFSCNIAMILAKELKESPRDIAQTIAQKLPQKCSLVKEASIAGPGFLNLVVTNDFLVELAKKPTTKSRKGQQIIIETNNPNPFKSMHIGHAFNSIIADTLANFLEASGAKTHRVSYHGDVGLHVGKSMWAVLKFIDKTPGKLLEIPESQRNVFMNKMYSEGAKAYKSADHKIEIDKLANQSFTKDNDTYKKVYDTLFSWSFSQIDFNIKKLGNKPVQKRFLESQANEIGVEMVKSHTPEVFTKSNEALVFLGSKYGSFDNVFVSSNGQGLYASRDLGLMVLKNNFVKADKSYIVTAEEQRDYFRGVIKAGELCLPNMTNITENISTGTVKLSTGKMSSRDGNVIDITWLFEKISSALISRGITPTEEVVAGALRYQFLKVKIGCDVVFDIEESIDVRGNSGPYLQYAHARACSILAKLNENYIFQAVNNFDHTERKFLVKLGQSNEAWQKATDNLSPHHMCNYLYELSQEFSHFYEKCRIINDSRQDERAFLVQIYRDTLEKGLKILGIDAPKKM